MVFYYKCELVQPPYILYVGADKNENDELIRWGWPEDVWFHVDKLSSAHVYLRLREGETLDDVPDAVIQDCAQLVKDNSIQVDLVHIVLKMNSSIFSCMTGGLRVV
ncbi:Coiled-coil domain-containing protein 25 [Fasciola hepatica]|uniref:Coiled-coil domain-containing protein 25 n=1 Tax=Fasciola hepatica TaxID=6192 RepID=A0A4E0RVJ9_FASHE|nr:Coiled-coil domain-containing protein 25 [Fasciola hepatica]